MRVIDSALGAIEWGTWNVRDLQPWLRGGLLPSNVTWHPVRVNQ